MKRLPALILLCAFGVFLASIADAQPRLLAPPSQFPEMAPVPSLPPLPQQAGPPIMGQPYQYESQYGPDVVEVLPIQPYEMGAPVELYCNVSYRNERKVPACAVPYLVEVRLPQPRRGCVSCGPECVLVKICVPPCETPCVRVRRRGLKTIYDFGRYEVEIVIHRGGRIVVDYNA